MIRHALALLACWTIGHRMGYREPRPPVWATTPYSYECLRCGWRP